MKLRFLGATNQATGSCFLVQAGDTRFLVDCGMLQGGSEARAHNEQPFAFDPADIDFVLLTHALVGHSGLLPRLCRAGFMGPILATSAASTLLSVLLPETAHIHQTEAAYASHMQRRRTRPLFTIKDAEGSLRQVRPIEYGQTYAPAYNVACRFQDGGHILGSAIVEVWLQSGDRRVKLVFSGALGQRGRPGGRRPAAIDEADVLVIESTYGDTDFGPSSANEDALLAIMENTLFKERGNAILPAFSVGRTQEILNRLYELTHQGRLKQPRIFIDTPMANEAARVTRTHLAWFDAQPYWPVLGERLPYLHFMQTQDDSRALNLLRTGAAIIAADNMCETGRVRHHLRHNLPRPECSVVLSGFQAAGSLGRALAEGNSMVRLFELDVPVRAQIYQLDGLSAHADRSALLAWAGAFQRPPAHTYVVQGEPRAAQSLAQSLNCRPGWHASVPEYGQTIHLLS